MRRQTSWKLSTSTNIFDFFCDFVGFCQPLQTPKYWSRSLKFFHAAFLTMICFFISYSFFIRHIVLNAHPDIGWISELIWQNPLQQLETQSYKLGWNSGWEFHISPFLSVASLFSYLWPGLQMTWMATFLAAQVSFIYWPLQQILRFRVFIGEKPLDSIFSYLIASLLTVGGAVTGSLIFPHYELFQITFFVWMLFGLHCKNRFIFYSSFALFLSVREDSLLFTIVLILVTLPFANQVLRRRLAALIALFSSSLGLIFLGRRLFFDTESIFSSDYLGNPPFDHLSVQFLVQRFELMIENNVWILGTIFCLVTLAVYNKVYRSIASVLPVFGLLGVGLLTFSGAKGTFLFYYSIPFFFFILFSLLTLVASHAKLDLSIRIAMALSLTPLAFPIFQNDFYLGRTLVSQVPTNALLAELESDTKRFVAQGYLLHESMYAFNPSAMKPGVIFHSENNRECVVVPLPHLGEFDELTLDISRFEGSDFFYRVCPPS
jgi:hypothetical protein